MLKRAYIQISLLIMMIPLVSAAATADTEVPKAKNYFIDIPENIFPLVTSVTRGDMVAYYENDHPSQATGVFNDPCSITALSDYDLQASLSDNVTCELFVLNPDSKDPVIGIITTVNTPTPESWVHFYTPKWQLIDSRIDLDTTYDDWLTPAGRKQRAEVQRAIPCVFASCTYDPVSRILTLTNNMRQYFVADDTPAELGMLKPALRYKWDGRRFKLMK